MEITVTPLTNPVSTVYSPGKHDRLPLLVYDIVLEAMGLKPGQDVPADKVGLLLMVNAEYGIVLSEVARAKRDRQS